MENELKPELVSRLLFKTKIKRKLALQVILLLWFVTVFVQLWLDNDFSISAIKSPDVQWCLSILCILAFSRFAFDYFKTIGSIKSSALMSMDEVLVKESDILNDNRIELIEDFGGGERLYLQKGANRWAQDNIIVAKKVLIDGVPYVVKKKIIV